MEFLIFIGLFVMMSVVTLVGGIIATMSTDNDLLVPWAAWFMSTVLMCVFATKLLDAGLITFI